MGSIFPIRILHRLWLVDLRHPHSSHNIKNGDQNNTWVKTDAHHLDFDNKRAYFSKCELRVFFNSDDLRRVSVREQLLASCQDTEDSSVTTDVGARFAQYSLKNDISIVGAMNCIFWEQRFASFSRAGSHWPVVDV